jgi:hypothetical protein
MCVYVLVCAREIVVRAKERERERERDEGREAGRKGR